MKPFLVILSLITGVNSLAQQDSVRKYLDENLQLTQKRNSVYAAMALRQADRWMLFAVYPDTTVILKMYFKDRALTVRDGPYSLYYPKKILMQQGAFLDNQANGYWQTWYANKQLKNAGTLVRNRMCGTWKSWFDNGQQESEKNFAPADSLPAKKAAARETEDGQNAAADWLQVPAQPGRTNAFTDFTAEGVLSGRSQTWYRNGNRESVVNYINDTLSGECTWYYENGQPSSRETYVNGKVTALECFDESGAKTGSACSIQKPPVLIHPFFSALDYIEYMLHKEKHKDIREEGEVRLSFVVTKEGKINKLQVLHSPDSALTRHIAAIFAGMPAWSPAIMHNRRLDYPVEMTVPYYRDAD